MAQAQTTHATTEAPGGAHEDIGFPPFETETYAGQLLWLAITFVALYFLLSRLVLPRLGGIIENRRATIASDLDDAAAMKSRAEEPAPPTRRRSPRPRAAPRPWLRRPAPSCPPRATRSARRSRPTSTSVCRRGDHDHGQEGRGHEPRGRHRSRRRFRHHRAPDRQGSGPARRSRPPRPDKA